MLKFYIITTLISITILYLTSQSIKARLKREGHVFKSEKTLIEQVHGCLPTLIPLLNIFIALIAVFFYEEAYQKVKLAANKLE